jgi:hypothetical protein
MIKVLSIVYNEVHRFEQTKLAKGSLILSLSQFLPHPLQPRKTTLVIKVVNIDSKIIRINKITKQAVEKKNKL